MSNHVTCEVCGRSFKRVTHKHLAHHSLTLAEYSARYPSAQLISDTVRSKLSTNKLSAWIDRYGETEGTQRYNEYKQMLADKNTFEYKQQKYGWSKEEFDQYNADRATTRDNMIKRYGPIEGQVKWDAYRAKQAIAGCTIEWFMTQYGADCGKSMYDRVCRSKRHTLSNYIEKYGVDVGTSRYYKWLNRFSVTHYASSKPEKELVQFLQTIYDGTMYTHLTRQFCKWSHTMNRAVMYDVVIPDKRIAVEFNGDFWHCNPSMYQSDYYHPVRKLLASQIWDIDRDKAQLLSQEGYRVITVWESDWSNNKHIIIDELTQCLM